MLKGSWTHFPDDKSLANAIKRLQLFRVLCDEVSRLPSKTRSVPDKRIESRLRGVL